jgi:hypothetical protein
MKAKVVRSIVYAIIWGGGLFCSTYFSAICNCDFEGAFEDIIECVLVPAYVVLALFLWDEAESIERTNIPASQLKKQIKLNFITLGCVVILVGCTGMAQTLLWKMVLLVAGWLGITCIKFLSLHFSKLQIEINKVP